MKSIVFFINENLDNQLNQILKKYSNEIFYTLISDKKFIIQNFSEYCFYKQSPDQQNAIGLLKKYIPSKYYILPLDIENKDDKIYKNITVANNIKEFNDLIEYIKNNKSNQSTKFEGTAYSEDYGDGYEEDDDIGYTDVWVYKYNGKSVLEFKAKCEGSNYIDFLIIPENFKL